MLVVCMFFGFTLQSSAYVDTAFDVGCFAMSTAEFAANPNILTGAAMVLDGAAVAFPFIPAVGGITIKAIASSPKLAKALKYGIKPYNILKNDIARLGLHAHHIMPKAFAAKFGIQNGDEMFSIALDPTTHQAITARMNSALPWWKTPFMSATQIKNTVKYVYQQMYYETEDYLYKFMADFIEAGQYVE